MSKKTVFVAGHQGMVGSAICRKLSLEKDINLLTVGRSQLDLTDQDGVRDFFASHHIDEVYLAAAKVGGISANNQYPADFISQNLMIQCNVIDNSFKFGVKRLLFLGSSCIYPKDSSQPITEDYLMSGKLELTNEPYAVAKIAGIKLCESYNRQFGCDFRSAMPTNLYGVGDNLDGQNSHVVPALIKRFHEAKSKGDRFVNVWGKGDARREFLYVDDLASAVQFIMSLDKAAYTGVTSEQASFINVGFGEDVSIKNLAEMIANTVGYNGDIIWDKEKPEGPKKKLLNSGVLNSLGWHAEINLSDGLKKTYAWYLKRKSIQC